MFFSVYAVPVPEHCNHSSTFLLSLWHDLLYQNSKSLFNLKTFLNLLLILNIILYTQCTLFFFPNTLYYLYIFPNAFSQRHSPKGNFPMATSNVNFPICKFPKVWVRPLRPHRLQWGSSTAEARMGQGAERCDQKRLGTKPCGQDGLGMSRLGKLHIW